MIILIQSIKIYFVSPKYIQDIVLGSRFAEIYDIIFH